MRIIKALAAGVAIGVIFMEAISAGMTALLPPDTVRITAIPDLAGAAVWPLWPAPALAWMIGAVLGSAMATAMSSKPACGLGVGGLLAVPAVLIVGLVTPGNPMTLLAAGIPLAGAAAGTSLAIRLRDEDAAVSVNDQPV